VRGNEGRVCLSFAWVNMDDHLDFILYKEKTRKGEEERRNPHTSFFATISSLLLFIDGEKDDTVLPNLFLCVVFLFLLGNGIYGSFCLRKKGKKVCLKEGCIGWGVFAATAAANNVHNCPLVLWGGCGCVGCCCKK